MTLSPSPPAGGIDSSSRSSSSELSCRLRALEHAMRTPVGTLAASIELLHAAKDRQGLDDTVQTMARQVRLLTTQLEQLHDIGQDLAAQEKGSA